MDAPGIRSLPLNFCSRLENEWPKRGASIIEALRTGIPSVAIRLNPSKWLQGFQIPTEWLYESIPWSDDGFFVGKRPIFTLDPLMHAGAYYVQDASSQILDEVLKQIGAFRLGLDLCAAPGGKSQILLKHLSAGGHLMCNEISRIRVPILEETLVKWGNPRASVWNWDARGFGSSDFCFDLILVDAPCSGEGLFRKDAAALSRWSTEHVQSCARRQRSIIEDILPCLAPGGVLIYATCTLATEENEDVWRYILKHDMEPVTLQIPVEWGWTDSSELDPELPQGVAFRMLPDHGRGEAFFICCFRKKRSEKVHKPVNTNRKNNFIAVHPVMKVMDPVGFLVPEDVQLVKIKKQHWLVSDAVLSAYETRSWNNCHKPGAKIGGWHPSDPAAPSHESALLSVCDWHSYPSIDLNEREAQWYLSGREFDPGKMPDGYFLVKHKGLALGWSKRMGRSMARSYPAAWRIKMQT